MAQHAANKRRVSPRTWVTGLLVVITVLAALSACSASGPSSRAAGGSTSTTTTTTSVGIVTPPRDPISSRIELASNTVASGGELAGTFVVSNYASDPLVPSPCAWRWAMTIGNDRHPNTLVFDAKCMAPEPLAVGVTTFPFTATADVPPGEYRVSINGSYPGRAPTPVAVHVTKGGGTVELPCGRQSRGVCVAPVPTRIELPSATMQAGTVMGGALVIHNNTGTSISLASCGAEPQLTNATVPWESVRSLTCVTMIEPGTMRVPLQIRSSPPSCAASGRRPCHPLPAGDYAIELHLNPRLVVPHTIVHVVAVPGGIK